MLALTPGQATTAAAKSRRPISTFGPRPIAQCVSEGDSPIFVGRKSGQSRLLSRVVLSRPPAERPGTSNPQPGFEPWNDSTSLGLQVLPSGLIYHSYLADVKESRFATSGITITIGLDLGHGDWAAGSACCATAARTVEHPEGCQLDLEGAAFPRLDLEHQEDVTSVDYRFGVPFTYGWDRYQVKFGYIHICSHLGDEFMLKNPGVERINYVRNGLSWGNSYYCTRNLRVYAETSWAFECDGGAKPWEFQFGIEYSPARPAGLHPKPFFAINGDIRQEVDYGGNICVETGYQWRGAANHLFRAGVQYFAGKSDQYEFFKQYEEKIGLGLWYDF